MSDLHKQYNCHDYKQMKYNYMLVGIMDVHLWNASYLKKSLSSLGCLDYFHHDFEQVYPHSYLFLELSHYDYYELCE